MTTKVRLFMLLAAAFTLAACQTSKAHISREILTGSYSYVSQGPEVPATDYNFNRLVLKSDGTYDLVEGGTTKSPSEKRGLWRIEPTALSDQFNLVLDHAGYPIEIRRNEIRLLIDLDTGVWWREPTQV